MNKKKLKIINWIIWPLAVTFGTMSIAFAKHQVQGAVAVLDKNIKNKSSTQVVNFSYTTPPNEERVKPQLDVHDNGMNLDDTISRTFSHSSIDLGKTYQTSEYWFPSQYGDGSTWLSSPTGKFLQNNESGWTAYSNFFGTYTLPASYYTYGGMGVGVNQSTIQWTSGWKSVDLQSLNVNSIFYVQKNNSHSIPGSFYNAVANTFGGSSGFTYSYRNSGGGITTTRNIYTLITNSYDGNGNRLYTPTQLNSISSLQIKFDLTYNDSITTGATNSTTNDKTIQLFIKLIHYTENPSGTHSSPIYTISREIVDAASDSTSARTKYANMPFTNKGTNILGQRTENVNGWLEATSTSFSNSWNTSGSYLTYATWNKLHQRKDNSNFETGKSSASYFSSGSYHKYKTLNTTSGILSDTTASVGNLVYINLNDIFTLARDRGSSWNYSSGASNKSYWTKENRPSFSLLWNQDLIKMYSSYKNAIEIINQIDSISSGWKNASDKLEAKKEAYNFRLNKDNFQEWKNIYFSSSNTNWILPQNVKSTSWQIDYLKNITPTGLSTTTMSTSHWAYSAAISKYFDYVLKNYKVEIDISTSVNSTETTETVSYASENNVNLSNLTELHYELSDKIVNAYGNSTGLKTIDIKQIRFVHKRDESWRYKLQSGTIKLKESIGNYNNKYGFNLIENTDKSLKWSFNFQPSPLDVGSDIQWTGLKTGIQMDDKFRITKIPGYQAPIIPSGQHSGHYGWDIAYYPWNRATNKFDSNARLFIHKMGGVWYLAETVKYTKATSTSIGSVTTIPNTNSITLREYLDSTHSVDEKNIQYVFSEELQLVINPYKDLIGQITPEKLSKATPSYGIKKVTNYFNKSTVTLEDWDDGALHHVTDANGLPLIDGIFGTDASGKIDPFSFFWEGTHEVKLTLYNFIVSFDTSWKFEVDTSGSNFELTTSSGNSSIVEDRFNWRKSETESSWETIYLASKEINISVTDKNLKDVSLTFNDSSANWYSIPLAPKISGSGNSFNITSYIKFNYRGFIHIKAIDFLDNEKNIFIFLSSPNYYGIQNGVEFDEQNSLGAGVKNTTLSGYKNQTLEIYKTSNKNKMFFFDTSPLHTNRTLSSFDGYRETSDFNYTEEWSSIEKLDDTTFDSYIDKITENGYARPIDNEKDENGLDILVGDSLKDFKHKFSQTAFKMLTDKFGLFLETNKLYRVEYQSLLESQQGTTFTYYLWINESNIQTIGDVLSQFTILPGLETQKTRIGVNVTPEREKSLKSNANKIVELEKDMFFKYHAIAKANATYLKYLDTWNAKKIDWQKEIYEWTHGSKFQEYQNNLLAFESGFENVLNQIKVKFISEGNTDEEWEQFKPIVISNKESYVEYVDWFNAVGRDLENSIKWYDKVSKEQISHYQSLIDMTEDEEPKLILLANKITEAERAFSEAKVKFTSSMETTWDNEHIEVNAYNLVYEKDANDIYNWRIYQKDINGNLIQDANGEYIYTTMAPLLPIWNILFKIEHTYLGIGEAINWKSSFASSYEGSINLFGITNIYKIYDTNDKLLETFVFNVMVKNDKDRNFNNSLGTTYLKDGEIFIRGYLPIFTDGKNKSILDSTDQTLDFEEGWLHNGKMVHNRHQLQDYQAWWLSFVNWASDPDRDPEDAWKDREESLPPKDPSKPLPIPPGVGTKPDEETDNEEVERPGQPLVPDEDNKPGDGSEEADKPENNWYASLNKQQKFWVVTAFSIIGINGVLLTLLFLKRIRNRKINK